MDAQHRQSYDAIQYFKVDKQRAMIRSVLLFERWSLRIHEVIVFDRRRTSSARAEGAPEPKAENRHKIHIQLFSLTAPPWASAPASEFQ